MKKKRLIASIFFLLLVLPAVFSQDIEKERSEFKKLLKENPNYFGTKKGSPLSPVLPISFKTSYEELIQIGYYPEANRLEAVINIKRPAGYGGDLCTSGTHEYVRFFCDWNNDNDYLDEGEDAGLASVNVHDIPDTIPAKSCLDAAKPLSYSLAIYPAVENKMRQCTTPYLVKVKAVLSWEAPPVAGDPDAPVVWGNSVERFIQIMPLPSSLVFTPGMQFEAMKKELLKQKKPIVGLDDLQKLYAGRVPLYRIQFKELLPTTIKISKRPKFKKQIIEQMRVLSSAQLIDEIIALNSNVQYEELRSVGLDYNNDQFTALLTVKLPYGYSGDLCTAGSREYVAFWAYVWNPSTCSCKWKYFGTTYVEAHDIPDIPEEDLQYAVNLSADLSKYKAGCGSPKILKVRGILSWNEQPDTTLPDFNPHWGNRVDALVQLKPVTSVSQQAYIWSAGTMAVESISGNDYSLIPSVLGPGYANGVSENGGFVAVESPFGGVMAISGTITQTNNVVWKYKMQYRNTVGDDTAWHDIMDRFRIWIRKNGEPAGYIDQEYIDGYFTYQVDLALPDLTEVDGNYLGWWYTAGKIEDGLYEIRMLVKKASAPGGGDVPAGHFASNSVKLVIDNTYPSLDLTIDGGACNTYKHPIEMTGKFTALDEHFSAYNLYIQPATSHPPTFDGLHQEQYPNEIFGFPVIPPSNLTGRSNQTYRVLITRETTPCGYTITLAVWDRTILNNSRPYAHWTYKTLGFCVLP